jgi:hypothetical protein
MPSAIALRRLVGPAVAIGLIGSIGLLGSAPASAAKTPKRPVVCRPSIVVHFGSGSEPEPEELSGALPASVLGSFAVFRRPALSSDLPPVLSAAGNELDDQLSSYYPGYVRRVAELSDGSRFFVIPALLKTEAIPPARCLPKPLRSQRPKLVEAQRKRAAEPVYCIVKVGSRTGGGSPDCVPFSEADQSPRVFLSGFTGGSTVDLVPDGVASVRITYRSVAPILARVNENAFVFTPPKVLTRQLGEALQKIIHTAVRPGKAKRHTKAQQRRLQKAVEKAFEDALLQAEPTRVEWLDGSGALLRSIEPPSSPFGNSRAPIVG